MTESEIMKALECCMDEMGCKKGCPCFDPKAKCSNCTVANVGLEKLALDLINRKNEQLATYEARNKALKTCRNHLNKLLKKQVQRLMTIAFTSKLFPIEVKN